MSVACMYSEQLTLKPRSTATMKHYYHPHSRAMGTHWMLLELEAPHEQVVVDFAAGETATDEFRAINPMGKLPTLVDGDVVVTESAAICAYLADKYIDRGLAPPLDSPARGSYYRYLMFPSAVLEPMFSFQQFGVTEYPAMSAGWGDIERCLAAIEVMCPAQDWVLGTQFTAADVVFGGTLDFATKFGWIEAPSDKLAGYLKRLKSRPAYRDSHDADWY